MAAQYLVSSIQAGYTDTLDLEGPYQSLEEAKAKTVQGRERGYDGDETRFVFYKLEGGKLVVLGYVLYHDECMFEEIKPPDEIWYEASQP